MTLRISLPLLPLMVFAVIGLGLLAIPDDHRAGAAEGHLDRPLPDFSKPGLTAAGKGISTADLNGEVSLLHVFASWCSTCRAEHPMLMRLAATAGTPIYGLNWKDRNGAALIYLDRKGDPYAAIGVDTDGSLGTELGVTGVPETYLVDAGGRIRYRHIGPITEETWTQVMQPMLAEIEAGT